MHNIDRNMLETRRDESFEADGFEMANFEYQQHETPGFATGWPGEQEDESYESDEVYEDEAYETDGIFDESEEIELAAELLEITDEQELDQFLGNVIGWAARKLRTVVKSPVGQALGGVLKGAISKALPLASGGLGAAVGGPLGGMIGKGFASAAQDVLGLEHESLSDEDREFDGAKQFVRLAGAAVQSAAAADPNIVPPRAIAQSAVSNAARSLAPGLLQPDGQGRTPAMSGMPGRRKSGRWVRRGSRIVLYGV